MNKRMMQVALIIALTASPALAQVGPPKIRIQQTIPIIKGRQLTITDGLPGMWIARGVNPLQQYAKGTFWRDPQWIGTLNLSADQQKKMDEVFRNYRIKLIDITAALEKDELMLTPLVDALPGGDEAKITAQIDKIADDRSELEKANSKMLVGIFQTLTPEQWNKLRENRKK